MTDEEKWKAVGRNDASYDGRFVYAVGSTGIFGRPSCASKLPLSKHVRFFRQRHKLLRRDFVRANGAEAIGLCTVRLLSWLNLPRPCWLIHQ